jgi:hypothetical protein
VLAVLDARYDLLLGRPIRFQLIRDHHTGSPALPLQQLAEQAFGRLPIATALNQDIKHDAVLIHGAPEIMLLAGYLEHHLIKMPLVAGPGQPPADNVGELLAELESHWRIVSWLTSMPRKASISATIRRLSGNLKYSHTV